MKQQFLYYALAFLCTSCASVKVKEINSEVAKTGDCKLEVYKNTQDVGQQYQVVCELESRTSAVLFSKRTPQAAIDNARSKACQCGADALIVKSSGRTAIKLFSWRRGTASLQAIRFL